MQPLVGQLGIPGVKPDITPIVGLFVNAPAPKPPASEVRAVKISVSELVRGWLVWLNSPAWSSEAMAQVLKEIADERGWEGD